MRIVTMTKDMRPWQAGHDVALPDDIAERLMASGDAILSPRHAGSGLQPDDPPRKPQNRYLTRSAKSVQPKDSAA